MTEQCDCGLFLSKGRDGQLVCANCGPQPTCPTCGSLCEGPLDDGRYRCDPCGELKLAREVEAR